MAFYALILLTIFIYLLYYYFTRSFNYWIQRKIQGPTPSPLFGNIKDLAFKKPNAGTIFKELYDQYPNEKVIGIFRMMSPCLLIRDLDVIKQIMIKDFDDYPDRGLEFSEENFGANLFSANENVWRPLRNRLTPLFTTAKLKHMVYLVVEKGDAFIDYLSTLAAEDSEQDIYTIVKKFTISTISACAFGLDIDLAQNANMNKLQRFDKLVFTRGFIHIFGLLFINSIKTLNFSIFPKEAVHFFRNLVNTVIQRRKNKPSNRRDFMDLFLELRQEARILTNKKAADKSDEYLEITDELIASQAFVFYVAGYETSATTMMYMIYELAMNEDIQENIIKEIDEVMASCDGDITYETLSKLTYMEMAFNETLRKYPLVDPLERVAVVDHKIQGTDVIVEKGQRILISPLGIHRDKKYYPNPEIFDPERFSTENVMKRHSCAYLPFGLGPRSCIGMRFAKLQSKVCLLKLFSKFRVRPSKNTPDEISFDPCRVVLSPKNGMKLHLIPRN